MTEDLDYVIYGDLRRILSVARDFSEEENKKKNESLYFSGVPSCSWLEPPWLNCRGIDAGVGVQSDETTREQATAVLSRPSSTPLRPFPLPTSRLPRRNPHVGVRQASEAPLGRIAAKPIGLERPVRVEIWAFAWPVTRRVHIMRGPEERRGLSFKREKEKKKDDF